MIGKLYVRVYKEQYACGLLTESTTYVHGLIDAQVHNYSPEHGGCYNRHSSTRGFEQYYS